MRFRVYDAYMLFRMADIMSRRGRRGRGVPVQKVKPLTDKEIEKRYSRQHRVRRHRIAWNRTHYSRANGRVVGIAFLLLLIVFLLLTIVVNMPIH